MTLSITKLMGLPWSFALRASWMMCTNGGSKGARPGSHVVCTSALSSSKFHCLPDFRQKKEALTDSCIKNLKVSPWGYPEFSVGDSRGSVFCVCVIVLKRQASLSLSRPLTCSRFPYPFSIFLVLHHPGLSLKTEKLQQKIIRSLGCSEITLFPHIHFNFGQSLYGIYN